MLKNSIDLFQKVDLKLEKVERINGNKVQRQRETRFSASFGNDCSIFFLEILWCGDDEIHKFACVAVICGWILHLLGRLVISKDQRNLVSVWQIKNQHRLGHRLSFLRILLKRQDQHKAGLECDLGLFVLEKETISLSDATATFWWSLHKYIWFHWGKREQSGHALHGRYIHYWRKQLTKVKDNCCHFLHQKIHVRTGITRVQSPH